MRLIVIVALMSILFAGCSPFKFAVKEGYCVQVALTHDTGSVDSLVCAGEEITDVIKKVEDETGFDIWEAVFKQVCKKAECSEKEPVNKGDDAVKNLLKQ